MREAQNESIREAVTPFERLREPRKLSTSPAQIKFVKSERNKSPSWSQTNALHNTFMHPSRHKRKEKEPDKFDSKNVAWQDYLVHFGQASDWNNLSYEEKSQQLVMSLRGKAQKFLAELS